jgi:hypothetical protein
VDRPEAQSPPACPAAIEGKPAGPSGLRYRENQTAASRRPACPFVKSREYLRRRVGPLVAAWKCPARARRLVHPGRGSPRMSIQRSGARRWPVCAHPVSRFPIAAVLAHPQAVPGSKERHNKKESPRTKADGDSLKFEMLRVSFCLSYSATSTVPSRAGGAAWEGAKTGTSLRAAGCVDRAPA